MEVAMYEDKDTEESCGTEVGLLWKFNSVDFCEVFLPTKILSNSYGIADLPDNSNEHENQVNLRNQGSNNILVLHCSIMFSFHMWTIMKEMYEPKVGQNYSAGPTVGDL